MSGPIYPNSGFPGGMSREQACMIFVLGTLEELKRKGLVEGGEGLRMTPKAWGVFTELQTMNFKPSSDEMKAAFLSIQKYNQGA